jgi:hypothetical protein
MPRVSITLNTAWKIANVAFAAAHALRSAQVHGMINARMTVKTMQTVIAYAAMKTLVPTMLKTIAIEMEFAAMLINAHMTCTMTKIAMELVRMSMCVLAMVKMTRTVTTSVVM